MFICKQCQESKPISEQSRGRPGWCYECNRIYRKAWYAKNSTRLRSREKKEALRYRTKLRKDVLEHYGGTPPSCACCGEMAFEFLCIDHIEGGGNQERQETGKRGYQWYSYLRTSGWPEGLRVLCQNCNSSYGHYGYCPHNKITEQLEKFNESIQM